MSERETQTYGVGIDVGGTTVRTGIVGADAQLVTIRSIRSEFGSGVTENAWWFAVQVRTIMKEAGIELKDIAGICLGIPGVVDAKDDVILSCPNARGLEGTGLAAAICHELDGVPVWLENDVNMAAVAEAWCGAAVGVDNCLFLAIGTGIGVGIIIDGKLYRGTGGAGEGGHMVIADGGPICACGKRGCYEALASGLAIEEAYTYGHSSRDCVRSGGVLCYDMSCSVHVSAREVFKLARSGDALALRVLEDATYYMGVGIANLVNLFAPELVVVGGGLGVGEWDFIRPRVEAVSRQHMRTGIRDRVRLARSVLGVAGGVLGCAKVVFDNTSRL